eukprot:7655182-Pyramimonas_sp.AAC.1
MSLKPKGSVSVGPGGKRHCVYVNPPAVMELIGATGRLLYVPVVVLSGKSFASTAVSMNARPALAGITTVYAVVMLSNRGWKSCRSATSIWMAWTSGWLKRAKSTRYAFRAS